MEVETNHKEIETTIKYPSWCLDDVDKAIHDILKKEEMSYSRLVKSIYEVVIKLVAKESLNERLSRLQRLNVITSKEKTKEFKVFILNKQ